MASCAFPNCQSDKSVAPTRFYAFPHGNKDLLEKWLATVNRPYWKPSRSDKLCEYHFNSNSFINNTYMKSTAVPTNRLALCGTQSKGKRCRICGEVNSDIRSIFDPELEILERISLVLPIHVHSSDVMSKFICGMCLGKLDVAYDLYITALRTDEKYKKSFTYLETKKKKKLPETLMKEGQMECDLCEDTFYSFDKFATHVVEHQGQLYEPDNEPINPIITCTDCGYLFRTKEEYEKHNDNDLIECGKCGEILVSKCSSNSHQCPENFCQTCNLKFEGTTLFSEHMKNHCFFFLHDGKGIKCESCRQIYVIGRNNIERRECCAPFFLDDVIDEITHRDLLRLSGLKSYYCNICGRVYELCKEFTRHMLAHIRGKPLTLSCGFCHTTFDNKGTLTVHYFKEHIPSHSWSCKECGKGFTTKISRESHERIHSGERPFVCEECGKCFRSRANLVQHKNVHTQEKNHPCPKCGKRFSRKAFVRTHMRVHTGERPFTCDVCPQKFTQVGDMKRHRSRHSMSNVSSLEGEIMSNVLF